MKSLTAAVKTLVLLIFISIIGGTEIFSQILEEGFNNPPNSARPKGYWCFVNGNFSLSQMTEELKEFKEKGMGGVDIWDVAGWVDPNGVVPAGPPFMGAESVQAIAHGIRVGTELDLDMGLTISSSWNAGGDWVEAKDGVMGLFQSQVHIEGPVEFSKALPFPEIPTKFKGHINMLLEKEENGLPSYYRDVAILAYPENSDSVFANYSEILDLTKHFKEGILSWEVPDGKWNVIRYVCTGTGQPLMRPSPNSNGLMIDHFNADAMKRNMNFFFEKLENELGDLSKTSLKYLYADSYEANSAVWTTKMPEEFEKRNGYNMIPFLSVLDGFTVIDEETSERFLFDFTKTLSDLIIENHYQLGTELCSEKGIGFIAEAGGPGAPIHNCPFESIKSLGACTRPRGEFWFDPLQTDSFINQLQIIKGPASAGHLYNRKRIEAEAFTGTQVWQFGPGDLKEAADKAMCEGLTGFVYHTSPHIPKEAGIPGWVYNFGTIINTTRAWWPKSKPFHEYIARCCFMLQQGNFVGDVLYYYGDKAPNFVPAKNLNPSLGFGYDYDVTNTDIILNSLDVKDGKFVLPHGQQYSILVLPEIDAINPTVLEKLEKLTHKGGVVVGNKPNKSHSLTNSTENDKRVVEVADRMWKSGQKKIKYGKGYIYTNENTLRNVLFDMNINPDVNTNRDFNHELIDYIHRKTDNADIYFIRNTSNSVQEFECMLRTSNGVPEIWNPDTQSKTKINRFKTENGITSFPLKLSALGSTFIVFKGGKPEKENKVYTIANRQLISGAWEIRFPYGWGAPQRTTFDELISWTESNDPGIKYFSGIAAYHKTFVLNETQLTDATNLILDLGEVSKVAEVFLNGKQLETVWHAPYKLDISNAVKTGTNYLVVEVANVLSNQMTGDALRKGREKRTHSNITKGPNPWGTPWEELSLIESGLLGPVQIEFWNLCKD